MSIILRNKNRETNNNIKQYKEKVRRQLNSIVVSLTNEPRTSIYRICYGI